MPFKFSRCLCLQSPDAQKAIEFYSTVLGLPLVPDAPYPEITAGQNRLFFDNGPTAGPIMEFLVPDLDAARDELVNAGCTVVRWEGKGKTCYIRDPFGFMFNLWEDPLAFQSK